MDKEKFNLNLNLNVNLNVNQKLNYDILKIDNSDLLNNYKVLENIYIDEGKTHKFITGSGIFNNENNYQIFKNKIISQPHKKDNNLKEVSNRNEDYMEYEKLAKDILSNKLISLHSILEKKNKKEFYDITPTFVEIKVNNLINLNNKYKNQKDDLIQNDICKCKLRDGDESVTSKSIITSDIRPKIKKQIYKLEYKSFENKNNKNDNIKIDINSNRINEVYKINKKIEQITSQKLNDIKENYSSDFKHEMEENIKIELKLIKKDIKANFNKKIEIFKTNLANNLKIEFENNKNEMIKEISKTNAKELDINEQININKNLNKSLKNKNEDEINKDGQVKNHKKSSSTVMYELTNKQLNKFYLIDKIECTDKNKLGNFENLDNKFNINRSYINDNPNIFFNSRKNELSLLKKENRMIVTVKIIII